MAMESKISEYSLVVAALAVLSFTAAGCFGAGGDGDADGDVDGDADGDGDGDVDGDVDGDADGDGDGDADGDGDGDADGDVDGDADGDGFDVLIHIRATAEEFPHDDGLAGQTPQAHSNGIRSFSMLRTRDDRSPLPVFDHGAGFVEAGYNDGDDTIVGGAPVLDLIEGHYPWGRVVISHMRYEVAATMHAAGLHVPGILDNVQVLSDGTEIDGEAHDAGWFHFEFQAATYSFPYEGDDAATIPVAPTGTPMELAFEDGEFVIYFPISITVDHSVTEDVHQIIEFNVDECFRWEDRDDTGFAAGVFDVSPTGWEPIRRFGANTYDIYVD